MTERLTLVVDNRDISRGNREWERRFAAGRRDFHAREERRLRELRQWREADRHHQAQVEIR